MSGVIPDDRVDAFERVIWRASRGKAVLRTAAEAVELLDRDTNTVVKKRAFALFFLGNFLKKKSSLMAQSFCATEYEYVDRIEYIVRMLLLLSVHSFHSLAHLSRSPLAPLQRLDDCRH